ncbi:complement C1q and tumor necrosis factor-related protein 9-like [Mytilus edulis]|uniref:complement C1q and tumor necrosis factor-related protein 9-like n=1 Tax=Mytilus edulis TaxID=6550 RepID=UPI0039EFFBB3
MDFILKLCLMFVLLQVVPSKSIRNNTDTDSKMDLMENSLENMEQRILNLTYQVTKLSKRKKDEHVMFYATLASDTVLNKNSIVRFNEIQYDEGADFNSGTGVFVSTVSGVYMLAWTIRTYNGKTIDTELKVDNVVKARQILQGTHSTRIQTSQFVICRVNEGDHVWIETGQGVTSENFFNEYHGSKSSFMGILIHRL